VDAGTTPGMTEWWLVRVPAPCGDRAERDALIALRRDG
jgi:hypothetical protein